ncbi:MAG: AAA family ATPase [Alphaproteobacteria bacterium]|nr:AAA family ATPase [Alphaproteobacteria bacterium]
MSINEQLQNIWVEKYRPSKLVDMVLTDTLRTFVEECKRKQEIPNLLLVGNAGTGKTTLAKVIINEILDAQYLYINASEKNGIDEVRTSILTFAQTKSLDGKIKIIFLDEFDNFTDAGQRALRNVMEEYAGNTRFILTGNYLHRIIQPIQSRCQVFTDFTPPIVEYAKRVVFILQNESISFDRDQIERLKEVIRYNYPDLRRIINYVQRNVIDGKLCIKDVINNEGFAQEILDKIVNKEDLMSLRKIVIESEQTFGNDYPKLLKDMFNAVYKSSLPEDKKRLALLQVSDSLYRSSLVMDQEINFFSCLIALAQL